MPGTSISGVRRLWIWGVALPAGLVALAGVSTPSWAASAPGSSLAAGPVSGSSAVAMYRAPSHSARPVSTSSPATGLLGSGGGDEPSVAGSPPMPSSVSSGLAAAVPAAPSAGADGAAGAPGAAGGQAAASTDLSVESVSAPPAAVPWILAALFILVVAGAVRAHGKSSQRAVIRSRRTLAWSHRRRHCS
jgi:hypothetical protein